MKTCVAACLRGAAVGVCVLFSAAGAALAQQGETDPNSEAIDATAAEPAEGTALPKVVVTSPKEKKKAATKKVSGKGTGSGADEAGATGEAAAQDTGGVAGAPDSDVKIDGVLLGGPATSDTGTTVFDSQNIRIRSTGGGDANSFMRNLPNVQYQNESDKNPGVDGAREIDTRPLLFSINGGRTYENNIILNGVSISTATGPIESNDPTLRDDDLTPNANGIYGLHPQQIFVPSEFLSQATVIDSNASAEYGEFQGGVVIYDLAKPPTDRYRASVTYSRHTDDMVNYILGTPDGLNTGNRKPPTFEKNNLAVSLGAPITTDFAFIAQASQKTAETKKQKAYYISDDWVDEESDNRFFRVAASLRTDIGKFTLDSSFTDYTQHWENMFGRDMYIDTASQGSSTQLEYVGNFPGIRVEALGLGGVRLKSRIFYNDSETTNESGDSVAYNWYNQRLINYNPTTGWSEVYDTTLHDDWCRGVDPATQPSNGGGLFNCREGGYGNKLQGQTDLGAQAHVTGDILLGNFKVGAEVKQIEGRRARFEDYVFVAVNTVATAANTPTGSINCTTGDNLCTSEQFASSISVFDAFDVSAAVNAYHTYAELDQTWWWFNVRAGVRLDYDDYFKNLNLAPRLAATITPVQGLSFTGGFNRYYLGETLYYAIRDKQPRGLTYSRTINATTGVPNGYTFNPNQANQYLNYQAAGLDTPYTDEFTGAVRIREPLLGGHIRLRYLERHGEDRFASSSCTRPGVLQCYELTNDGESFYRSATAEYTKAWNNLDTPFFLNAAAITGQVTWSEQSTSRGSYLNSALDPDGDSSENLILYKGQSYSPISFMDVTGNLDIPIRIGATLSTIWFDDVLLLGLSAGYNLGYDGVYDTGRNETFPNPGGRPHDVWEDRTFGSALMLDAFGQINVTENAAIEFEVNNIANTAGNSVTTYANPWVRGRSYWVGSTVRF